MNINVHSAEKVGPMNLGAGPNDYIYKLFGTSRESGRVVNVTISVSKGEYEGMVIALVGGRPAESTVHESAVLAIQVTGGVEAATTEAIEKTRAKSVRTQ